MRKTKEEANQTRCNLLDSALNVFYEKGVSQASLDEVAKTAGVTRGALYWHFKNKEELFDALFQIHSLNIERQMKLVLQPNPDHDPLTLLFKGILEYFNDLTKDPYLQKFCALMHPSLGSSKDNDTTIQLIHQYHAHWDEVFIQVLNECKRLKILNEKLNVERAWLMIVTTITGLTIKWLDNPKAFNLLLHAEPILLSCFDSLKQSPHLLDD